MNNKLILRILGAISSALIAVSVFLPYVSVTGYSESLWEIYKVINTLYLPIMIIIFGVIGVIFFALNIKTEFAYTSAGAVLFFVVMQTFDVVNQGTFNTLSVGYYFLALGSISTGVMAFLCNLNTKKQKKTVIENTSNINPPQLNQVNNMDQNIQPESISPIQPVEPIPMAPIEEPAVNPIPEQLVQPIPEVIPEQSIMPIPEVVQEQPMVAIPEIINEQPVSTIPKVNIVPEPAVQSISEVQPQINVPEVSDSSLQPQSDIQQLVNPAIDQFAEQPINPVVQEFMLSNQQQQNNNMNNEQTLLGQTQVQSNPTSEPNTVVQGFTNQTQDLQVNQNNNNGGIDIFGQPINK